MDFDTAEMDSLSSIMAEYETPEYADAYLQRRQQLRNIFASYRSATPEQKERLNDLVKRHTENCHTTENSEIRRRHNTFVLRYIADRQYTPKEIARIQGITVRTVYKDLNRVLDDMMVLVFGDEGLPPQIRKNTEAAVCGNEGMTGPARKRGAPIGNRNAVGNHGGAPLNNTNALKHGGYAAISSDDLTEREWELVAAMPTDCEQLLMDEISLLSVREWRIMHRIAKLRGVENGLIKAATVRTEEKREFSGEEEQREYQACVDAAVQAGERLPGHPYRITVTQEAVHNIILRMEDDLTRCQEIKRKAVELLSQMQTDLAPSSTDIDDMIIAALRGPQRKGTGPEIADPRRF